MCSLKILSLSLMLIAMPSASTAQQPVSQDEVVDKILAQEQAEVQLLRQYTPLVETYIQYLRADNEAGAELTFTRVAIGRGYQTRRNLAIELSPEVRRKIFRADGHSGGEKQ